MAKSGTFEYGIKFDVDGSSLKNVKSELTELKTFLQEIQKQANLLSPGTQLSKDFNEAAEAASKLEIIMNEAWNSKLNQLDLTKFNQQLTNAFGNMKNLQNALKKAGEIGANSFEQFSRSILHSNLELKESSTLLNKMAITMSNTIRFGISSSVFNNLVNSISKSYNYVKKLDSSLNDIRIVTGQSADQMERFARQANNVAKNLGATTLDYTNASLIYYQQGLSDQEVAERTEVTVKMANVLGTSAQEVSDYMTAIWNNFDSGSKSLEYFADVITALGAATAASSEEIAEGLNKFAAVADTVGLSYEYATAALATVVAKTRQSADIVGTAFKTLFARIQDLELGKTLDDGTTLGKYADALNKVGINIKNQHGELKSMNEILNEMGSKWQSLNKDQQVALAQNVAGTRQYTQLIALMDDWDKFQENLIIAEDSTGSLQEKQDIYLDSIEAHLNKLTAASEKLYSDIFDEESIKTFADALTNLLGIADNLVQGLGGGLNSFVYFGSILSNVFNVQIGGAINRQIINMERLGAAADAVAQKTKIINDIQEQRSSEGKSSISSALETEAEYAQRILNLRNILTKEEYNTLTIKQKQIGDLQTEIDLLKKSKEDAKILLGIKKDEELSEERLIELQTEAIEKIEKRKNITQNLVIDINKIQDVEETGEIINPEVYLSVQNMANEAAFEYNKLREITLENLKDENLTLQEKNDLQKLSQEYLEKYSSAVEVFQKLNSKDLQLLQDQYDEYRKIGKELEENLQLQKEIEKDGNITLKEQKELQQEIKSQQKAREELLNEIFEKESLLTITQEEECNLLQNENNLRQKDEETLKDIANAIKGIKSLEDGTLKQKEQKLMLLKKEENEELKIKERQQQISSIVSGISTLTSVFSSGKGLLNTWFGDNDLSTWDKINQSITVMAATLPILINGWKNLHDLIPNVAKVLAIETTVQEANNVVRQKSILTLLKEIIAKGLHIIATKLQILWQTILNIVTGQWDKVAGLAVVAIMAIATAIGVWIAKIIQAHSEEARLQAQVKRTAESVKKAKEEYDKLKESVTAYTDARSGIDDLTEGTVEFYEAIVKANEKAQELIDTLNLIPNNGYTIDKNGLITINEDILEGALYRQQQEIYKRQARNDITSANLEQYNRRKIVENFQIAVNDQAYKQGIDRYITKEQAELILKNSDALNTEIGNLTTRTQHIYDNFKTFQDKNKNDYIKTIWDNTQEIQGTIDSNTVEITESMKTYLSQYKASTAKIEAYELRAVRNDLFGYLTQEEAKQYRNLNVGGQDAIIQLMNKAKKNSRPNEQYNEDFKSPIFGRDMYDLVENGAWYDPFAWGAKLGNWLTGDEIGQLREEYAQKSLGYSKTNGIWYDPEGNPITNKKMDKVLKSFDIYDAVLAHNSGEYQTQENYENIILPTLQKAKDLAISKNLKSSSESYITEALLRLQAGTFDKDFANLLTNEEKSLLQSGKQSSGKVFGVNIANNISNEQLNQLLQLTDEADRSLERIKSDLLDYNNILANSAKELDTTTEALKFYGYAMYNASKETNEMNRTTAEAIADQYKFNKMYNKAVEIYYNNEEAITEYTKALSNNEDIAYDVADAMGELSISLKNMGLSMSTETISTHLAWIKQLLTGDKKEAEEAYKVLLSLAQLDTLKEMFGPEAENQLQKYGYTYQELIDAINSTDAGTYLSQTYADALGKMITDTELTIDQIQQLADGLNITIPVEYNVPEKLEISDKEITTKATSTLHRYTGEMPNPAYDGTNSKTIPVDYTWVETVEDKTDHFLVPKTTEFTVNKNTQSIGGKRNFSKTSSNKKSGGGSDKPDKMDPIEKNIDRYHKVNTQITKVENSLKKLQNEQKKFVGAKLIDNLNKQWELLNTQINNYNKKLEIANGEYDELRKKLSDKGVLFNEDGTVQNYVEAIRNQEAYVNALITQYNTMAESEQENFKKNILEPAQKDYEDFLKNIDRIDELSSEFIPGLRQSIFDALDKQIEISIQKFNMKIEITLDMNQATREWNQWKKRIIDGIKEDDILGNAQARIKDYSTYYNTEGNGDVQEATRHVNEILEALAKMDAGIDNTYGNNREQALEDLKTYYDQLRNSLSEVLDLQEEIHQAVLDEMDRVQEKFSEQVHTYELLSEIIQHDLKITQMYLGEDAYGEMSKFYEKQQENYEKQLEFQRMQKDFWYAEMEAAEEGSKEWESAREKWESAVQEFNNILEQGLENAKNKFENAINDIFKKLNESITGGMGLDYVKTEWDLINENADRYLDTINKTYGIKELEKKYQKAINDSSQISVQQRLQKVMTEQVNKLKEKEKVTQYDIDRANKLYEIELARIQLEEAAANKSQMRLRRDSQGNYTYQYVTNQAAIDEAQNKIDELYNSLYNFDKERYNQVLNDAYDAWNDYQQAMAEAALINDPELRAERERMIQEQYNELMMQIANDYETSKFNLSESFNQDLEHLNETTYNNLSEKEKEIVRESLIPTWKNGLSEMVKEFTKEGGFAKVTQGAWDAIKAAQNQYKLDTDALAISAGTTFETISKGLDDALPKTSQLLKDNQELVKAYDEELKKVKGVWGEVQTLIGYYEKAEKAAKRATEAAYDYQQQEKKDNAKDAGSQSQPQNTTNPDDVPSTKSEAFNDPGSSKTGGGSTNTTNDGSGGTPTPSKSPQKQKGDNPPKTTNTTTTNTQKQETYTITKDYGYSSKKEIVWVVKGSSITLEVPSRSGYIFEGWEIPSLGITTFRKGRTYIPKTNETVKATWSKDLILKSTPVISSSIGIGNLGFGMATGGYTGEWNNGDNNGRLAWLHQKELVLNSKDTKNLLDSVEVIRNLNYSLGSNTLARLAGVSANIHGNNISGGNGLFEQDVHIDATFPNVHNAAEIETALNNLVNAASQRVMEKR